MASCWSTFENCTNTRDVDVKINNEYGMMVFYQDSLNPEHVIPRHVDTDLLENELLNYIPTTRADLETVYQTLTFQWQSNKEFLNNLNSEQKQICNIFKRLINGLKCGLWYHHAEEECRQFNYRHWHIVFRFDDDALNRWNQLLISKELSSLIKFEEADACQIRLFKVNDGMRLIRELKKTKSLFQGTTSEKILSYANMINLTLDRDKLSNIRQTEHIDMEWSDDKALMAQCSEVDLKHDLNKLKTSRKLSLDKQCDKPIKSGLMLEESDVIRYCNNLRIMANNFKRYRTLKSTDNFAFAINRLYCISPEVVSGSGYSAELDNLYELIMAEIDPSNNLRTVSDSVATDLSSNCKRFIEIIKDHSHNIRKNGLFISWEDSRKYDIKSQTS